MKAIDDFDPSSMLNREALNALYVGPTNSGKTTALFETLRHLGPKVDQVIVFCPTEDTIKEFRRHAPNCTIHSTFSIEKLREVIEAQRKIGALHRAPPGMLDGPPVELPYTVIILDDFGFDKKMLACKEMNYLLMNGRHDHFLFFMTLQYIMGFPKSLRGQIGMVVAYPYKDLESRDVLRKNILGVFRNDREMQDAFNELAPHEGLVVMKNGVHRPGVVAKPQDVDIFGFLPPYPIPEFLMGSRKSWYLYYMYRVPMDYKKMQEDIRCSVEAAATRPAPPPAPEETAVSKDGAKRFVRRRKTALGAAASEAGASSAAPAASAGHAYVAPTFAVRPASPSRPATPSGAAGPTGPVMMAPHSYDRPPRIDARMDARLSGPLGPSVRFQDGGAPHMAHMAHMLAAAAIRTPPSRSVVGEAVQRAGAGFLDWRGGTTANRPTAAHTHKLPPAAARVSVPLLPKPMGRGAYAPERRARCSPVGPPPRRAQVA